MKIFPVILPLSLSHLTCTKPIPISPCRHDEENRKPCPAAAPITHLTLRHGKGKLTLSSSAYKYQRRNQQKKGSKILEKEQRTNVREEEGGGNQRQLLGVGIFGEGKSDQQKKKDLRLCTEKKTTFLTSHHFCSLSFEIVSTAGATPAPPLPPALSTPPSFFLSLMPSSSPASFAATLVKKKGETCASV